MKNTVITVCAALFVSAPSKSTAQDSKMHLTGIDFLSAPRLDLRVGKRGVDLSVKLANDLSRRVLRSAEAEPATKQRGAERLALALRPFPFLGCPHTRKGNQARS
jgi:hypothetical protein